MGMFDYVRCDYPLPLPEYQDRQFQTKDLEDMMSRYRITFDGYLLDGFGQQVIYDGDVYFYTFADEVSSRGWVTFRATFRHGFLTEMAVVEHTLAAAQPLPYQKSSGRLKA